MATKTSAKSAAVARKVLKKPAAHPASGQAFLPASKVGKKPAANEAASKVGKKPAANEPASKVGNKPAGPASGQDAQASRAAGPAQVAQGSVPIRTYNRKTSWTGPLGGVWRCTGWVETWERVGPPPPPPTGGVTTREGTGGAAV